MSDHDPTNTPAPQQQQNDFASPQQPQRHRAGADAPPPSEMPIPGAENLFAPSAIKLFGREFAGLSVNRPFADGRFPIGERARLPPDNVQGNLNDRQGYRQMPGRLERALRKVSSRKEDNQGEVEVRDNYARFARIYSFAYEGQYYEMPRPVLFLVYGPGVLPETPNDFQIANVGIAAKDWKFASDIRMWEVDDKDIS